jgi:hypothetical protein
MSSDDPVRHVLALSYFGVLLYAAVPAVPLRAGCVASAPGPLVLAGVRLRALPAGGDAAADQKRTDSFSGWYLEMKCGTRSST